MNYTPVLMTLAEQLSLPWPFHFCTSLPGKVAKHFDVGLCISALFAAFSKTGCPNINDFFSVHVACDRGSILLRRCCDMFCTSCLWMTSYFHIGLTGYMARGAGYIDMRRSAVASSL